jgi:hypothetical protein
LLVGGTPSRGRGRPPPKLPVIAGKILVAELVPVLHAVLEYRYGESVELKTGRPKQVLLRTEAWYGEERQLFCSRAWH